MSSAVYEAPSEDHYATLGVNRFASTGDIKKAYKNLALKLHPDKNPDGSTQKVFSAITDAYSVLNDASSKKSYDIKLYASQVAQTRPRPAPQGNSFGGTKVHRPQTATATSSSNPYGSNIFGSPRTGSSTGGFRPAAPKVPTPNTGSNPSANPTTPPSVNVPKPQSTASAKPAAAAASTPTARSGSAAATGAKTTPVSGYTLSSAEVNQLNQMRARDNQAANSAKDYDRFLRDGQFTPSTTAAGSSSKPKTCFASPPTSPRTTTSNNNSKSEQQQQPTPPSTPPSSTARSAAAASASLHEGKSQPAANSRPGTAATTSSSNNNTKTNRGGGSFSYVTEDTVNSVLEAIRAQREELEKNDHETKIRLNVNDDDADLPKRSALRPQSATVRRTPSSDQVPINPYATSHTDGHHSGLPDDLPERPQSSCSSGIWTRNLRPTPSPTPSAMDNSKSTFAGTSARATQRPQTAKARIRVPVQQTPPPQPEKKEEPEVIVTRDEAKVTEIPITSKDASAAGGGSSNKSSSDGGEAESKPQVTTSSGAKASTSPTPQAAQGSAAWAAAEARRAYQKSLFEASMPAPLSHPTTAPAKASVAGPSAQSRNRPASTPLAAASSNSSTSGPPATPVMSNGTSAGLIVPSDKEIGDLDTEALKKLLEDLDRKTRLARQELLLRNLS